MCGERFSAVVAGRCADVARRPCPIAVPGGVTVTLDERIVTVAGPQGTLTRPLPGAITVRQEESALLVERPDDQRQNRALHGLTRSLVANMVTGVTAGFSKDLEIVGVGYRALAKGPASLELALGFSHPVNVDAPEGVIFEVPTPTRIVVKGIDKEKVGQVAADIRKLRKPEPYKGKGIRYAGERVDPQGRQGGQVAMATAASAQEDPAHPAPRPGPQADRGHHEPAPAGRVPLGTPHLRPGHRRHRRPHAGRGEHRGGGPAQRHGRQRGRGRQRSAGWSPTGPNRRG